MKVVLVKFEDPTTFGNWATPERMEESAPNVCYGCGLLLAKNKKTVKIGLLHAADGETVSDWIVIPRGCIVSMETIKEVKLDG